MSSEASAAPAPAQPFPYLLRPVFWAARNRARRRDPGDRARAVLFGGIGIAVAAAIFAIVFWLTWQLLDYEELGDYLIRLGLSWLFLTFLSFLAFSGVVTALSTFFLSEDMRLLMAAPVAGRRLFYSRFARTVGQASWMVVAFLVPALLAVGVARCAGTGYYATIVFVLGPFVLIPVALGCAVTLLLVNIFPARRARDILMIMGLAFATALVLLLRFLRPERLLNVQTLPDVTAFFATLQSPVMPLLPSFWAGETLFTGLQGGFDRFHASALWSTALASAVLLRMAFDRFYFTGWTKAQEARKARFTRLRFLERLAGRLPLRTEAASLLVKDMKVFLRDTTQWSQLLLLVALTLVYVYNFRVLDLERIPYLSRTLKNLYAFVNLGMAGFVLSAVAVRFIFPAVSAEGGAFWVVRTSPVSMKAFLWSKFWTGLVPVVILAECLTIVSNHFLGVTAFLQVVTAAAVFFMSFALVGLAAGMGARYPRFNAESMTQVAGSYGGIAFMVAAVFFTLLEIVLVAWPSSVYFWYDYRHAPVPSRLWLPMGLAFGAAIAASIVVFWTSMKQGVQALEEMG